MPAIIFKTKFLDLIRSGKKTQTMRSWEKTSIKPGQICTATNFKQKIPIKIKSITFKCFSDITKNDAMQDGFSDINELKIALNECYGVLPKKVCLISFSLHI